MMLTPGVENMLFRFSLNVLDKELDSNAQILETVIFT